jgi:ParB-like chromosome segregation protein Spo0J
MERQTAGEVEIASVDLRYERCRVRDVRAERELLAEISMRGIDRPLAGVEAGARWILIDGFKRFRCARSLGMGSVPCLSLGADEAAGIIEVLKGPGWRPLGFLEEARFLRELNSVHGMSLGEMAAALGRSKGWRRSGN